MHSKDLSGAYLMSLCSPVAHKIPKRSIGREQHSSHLLGLVQAMRARVRRQHSLHPWQAATRRLHLLR